MAIAVSRKKKADMSVARCVPESGRISLESTCHEESNGTGFECSAWL